MGWKRSPGQAITRAFSDGHGAASQQLVQSDGQVAYPLAGRVVDGVRDRGDDACDLGEVWKSGFVPTPMAARAAPGKFGPKIEPTGLKPKLLGLKLSEVSSAGPASSNLGSHSNIGRRDDATRRMRFWAHCQGDVRTPRVVDCDVSTGR
jgi:hypothetical protein